MTCRYCGHWQNDGSYCNNCGKPIGSPMRSNNGWNNAPNGPWNGAQNNAWNGANTNSFINPVQKRSKAPVIALVALAGVLLTAIVVVIAFMGKDKDKDKIKTDDSAESAVTAVAATKTGENTTAKQTDTSSAVKEPEQSEKPETSSVAEEVAPPEPVRIIPAVSLLDMSTEEIKELVGDDYRVCDKSEHDAYGYQPDYGITSDKYFPNTVIYLNGDEDETDAAERFENGNPIIQINVYKGGLIGDKAKVGDRYHDMMVMIDSLGGLNISTGGNGYATCYSYIDGHKTYLTFDHLDELEKISKQTGYNVVDGYHTQSRCVQAVIGNFEGGYGIFDATVTADGVALRVAPDTDASILLNVNTGDKLRVVGNKPIEINGDTWYNVEEYNYKGIHKHGYIHAEYVKID